MDGERWSGERLGERVGLQDRAASGAGLKFPEISAKKEDKK